MKKSRAPKQSRCNDFSVPVLLLELHVTNCALLSLITVLFWKVQQSLNSLELQTRKDKREKKMKGRKMKCVLLYRR